MPSTEFPSRMSERNNQTIIYTG